MWEQQYGPSGALMGLSDNLSLAVNNLKIFVTWEKVEFFSSVFLFFCFGQSIFHWPDTRSWTILNRVKSSWRIISRQAKFFLLQAYILHFGCSSNLTKFMFQYMVGSGRRHYTFKTFYKHFVDLRGPSSCSCKGLWPLAKVNCPPFVQ